MCIVSEWPQGNIEDVPFSNSGSNSLATWRRPRSISKGMFSRLDFGMSPYLYTVTNACHRETWCV
jgi:hypothetical protein